MKFVGTYCSMIKVLPGAQRGKNLGSRGVRDEHLLVVKLLFDKFVPTCVGVDSKFRCVQTVPRPSKKKQPWHVLWKPWLLMFRFCFFTFIAKACGHLDKRTRTRMTSQTKV